MYVLRRLDKEGSTIGRKGTLSWGIKYPRGVKKLTELEVGGVDMG